MHTTFRKRNATLKNKRKAKAEAAGKTKTQVLALIATVVSLLATALTLIGYGVAISVEDLGIPHESLYTSPFEILGLSEWAMVYVFNNIGKLTSWHYYFSTLVQLWFILACGLFGIGLAFFIVKSTSQIERLKRRYPNLQRVFFQKTDSHLVKFVKMLVFYILFWFALPLMYQLLAFAIVLMSGCLVAAPALGLNAGRGHIHDDVMVPATCIAPRTREEWLAPKLEQRPRHTSALCVALRNEKTLEVTSGRVVFTTPSAIVLFDPVTGKAVRLQIKDVPLRAVDKL